MPGSPFAGSSIDLSPYSLVRVRLPLHADRRDAGSLHLDVVMAHGYAFVGLLVDLYIGVEPRHVGGSWRSTAIGHGCGHGHASGIPTVEDGMQDRLGGAALAQIDQARRAGIEAGSRELDFANDNALREASLDHLTHSRIRQNTVRNRLRQGGNRAEQQETQKK